ncbi:MAG TPA: hypothetical protein VGO80_06445 [Solirubrobacteraceae bacterium]|nr:hypothetical protein [Solirubrobacteraceae bacterium]
MSTATKPRALHWSVGVNTFGVLLRPDGEQGLVELVRFDEREAAVVRLSDGDRELVPWSDGEHLFIVVDDEVAAARAGMPAPRRVKVGSGWRRIDPFHTERHCSAKFRALVALIYAQRLPCRYSLIAAGADGVSPDYSGPAEEDPEQTAANTAERLARLPALTYREALHAELLEDAALAVGPRDAEGLLARFGWPAILALLDEQLAVYATDVPELREGSPSEPVRIPDTQLNLFGSATA